MRTRLAAHRARWTSGTFLPLLAALLITLVIAPFAADWTLESALIVAAVLVAGVFAVHRNRRLRVVVLGMVLVVLVLRWLAHQHGHSGLVVAAHLGLSAYFVVLAVLCLMAILRHRRVTLDTVVGAVCGYLLIAFVFAFGYAALEDARPGSFVSSVVMPGDDPTKIGHGTPELMYFSFVILTTVGFGDIVPASRLARSLTIFEMLAGQLYLAAFVARLVGILGTEVNRNRGPDAD